MRVRCETISLETANRLYLVKHHLHSKARREDLVNVVNNVCGLHAQAWATPYLSLWNRVEDFEDDLLDSALYRDKTLVKVWCMRGTLHVIPSEDLSIYNRALKRMWFEHHGRFMHTPDWPSPDERKRVIYPKILQALAEKPLKRKELNAKVRLLLKDDSKPYKRLFSGWGGILKETGFEGLTVHAQPCERDACFARTDKWIPHVNWSSIEEEEAQERLLIKYLNGYGPASVQDFVLWSGLMVGDVRKAVEKAEGSLLEQVEIEGVKGRFWMLRRDSKLVNSLNLEEKAPPCLLPKFDSFVLGHKDRTRIIADRYKKHVFRKAGDVSATLLINGNIAGTWKQKKNRNTLTVTIIPFQKLMKEDLNEVEEKAQELRQFMGVDNLKFSLAF
jgi:uncharacterized protein YcaQ